MAALTLRAEAGADIREAADWYEGERPGLGRAFTRAVRALLATMARAPERFPRAYGGMHEDVRRALLRRFPYAVYFVAEPDGVVVLACVHFRRDPQVWQSRR